MILGTVIKVSIFVAYQQQMDRGSGRKQLDTTGFFSPLQVGGQGRMLPQPGAEKLAVVPS